jgi:very-short-patch-repair endonuclease
VAKHFHAKLRVTNMNQNKTTPSIRGTTPEIERRAKELRCQMTPAESRLWEALRGMQLEGLRFRRQHPVGRFILDFYCPAPKLVVEVDGGIHADSKERDDERTAYLNAYGYQVLRIRNEEIETDLAGVLAQIRDAVRMNEVSRISGG